MEGRKPADPNFDTDEGQTECTIPERLVVEPDAAPLVTKMERWRRLARLIDL